MIALTSELEQKIKQNGGTIHYVTLEEFQEIMSKGEVLTNEQVKEQFNIYNKIKKY
jgi:hypothetical protein